MPNPKLQVEIGATITDLERSLAKAEKSLKKFSDKSKALGKQFQSTGLKMSLALTAPLAILGSLAVKTAADFETLGVSLNTTFQGNEKAAKAAFDQIIKFAAKTPFQVEQVTSAFIKLKNFGLDPSEKALTSYGDTAAAMGKSLDQMVEAVADAATGEFERLKEFGIKASSQGDKVSFTFRGVTTTIQKEAAAIEGFLIGLGETEFAGGMEAQSKTFTGQLSTLKDNVALLSNEFGKILIEMINPLISKIGMLAKKFQELSPEWKKTIVVVGLVVAALGPLLTILGLMMTTVIPGLITVFAGLKIAVLATSGAFSTLTAAMLANPIGLIVAAVAALIVGLTKVLQKLTGAKSALKTFFNLVKSAGDPQKFLTLQLLDTAAALEEDRKAAQKAAKASFDFAVEQANAKVEAQKLTKELLKQAKVLAEGGGKGKPSAVIGTDIKSKDGFTAGLDVDPISSGTSGIIENLRASRVAIAEELGFMFLNFERFRQASSDLIQGSIADTFGQLGEAIGQALANGSNVFEAVGQTILKSIGNFLTDFGKLMIQYGIAALAYSAATKGLTNPLTAGPSAIALIAAGTALTIIGSAVQSALKSGGGSDVAGDTGGGGSFQSSGSSVGTSQGSFSSGGTVVFEIAGTKLVGVLSRTLDRNKALGGSNTDLFG